MVTTFHRPRDAAEAQSLLNAHPSALPLAGGTWLLTGQFRKTPLEVVSVDGLLPSGIERLPEPGRPAAGTSTVDTFATCTPGNAPHGGFTLALGALATFQSIADSPEAPAPLREAVLGMADRNIRNRATVGGNIGAGKSCASLIPLFLVTDAVYECASGTSGGAALALPAAEWTKTEPAKLIVRVALHFETERLYACRRWSRTACDLSVITVAVSYRLDTPDSSASASATTGIPTGAPASSRALRGLRIALGGMGASARRFPEIEAVLEGKPLPARDELESLVAPFFDPKSDARGSAEFKRYRAACLVAEALLSAQPVASVAANEMAAQARAGAPASSSAAPEVQP